MSGNEKIGGLFALLLLLAALTGCSAGTVVDLPGESLEESGTPAESESPAETQEGDGLLYVYVCGHVRDPGVYSFPATARVMDAVAAAGGFDEEADTEYWNLAQLLEDGQQIRVPSEEEQETAAAGTAPESGGDGRVNLNTATKEELMSLPGIGEVKAEAILAYREENGAFSSIEEIMNVSGIKEAGFAKIRDQITV